jgi:hypothetical protein
MKTKLLSFSRIVLLIAIFMQVVVTQAEEVQLPLGSLSNGVVQESVQTDSITLTQFKSMNWKELDAFFKQYEKDVLPRFRTGRTFSYIGLGAMIPGVLITTTGVVLMSCFPEYPEGGGKYVIFRTPEYLGGIFLTSLGSVITALGVSFTIAGFDIKNQCKKSYINEHFNNTNISTLKVGCTSNGIGLTLNF